MYNQQALQWIHENMDNIDSNNEIWLKNTQYNTKMHDWSNLRTGKGLETDYKREKYYDYRLSDGLSPTRTKTAWKMLSMKEYSSTKLNKSK